MREWLLLLLVFATRANAFTVADCYRNDPGTYAAPPMSYAFYGDRPIINLSIWCTATLPAHDFVCGSCGAFMDENDPQDATLRPPRCPATASGSIIDIDNQVLREQIPVSGGGVLAYSSLNTFSRLAERQITIPVTGADVSPEAISVRVDVQIAGQRITTNYGVTPNQSYVFTWDGKNDHGNLVLGGASARVEVTTHYNLAGMPDIPYRFIRQLGHYNANNLGLGGLTYSAVNAYDPAARQLYRGAGDFYDVVGQKVLLSSTGQVSPITDDIMPYDHYSLRMRAGKLPTFSR